MWDYYLHDVRMTTHLLVIGDMEYNVTETTDEEDHGDSVSEQLRDLSKTDIDESELFLKL